MFRYLLILWLFLFSCTGFAKNYAHIDAKAEDAPSMVSEENFDELVNKLVGNYSKDEDKARAILAWIVKNIDYDDYRFKKLTYARKHPYSIRDYSVPASDILKVHLGVCADIAKLYVRMAQRAGLTARVVEGYAGFKLTKSNYENERHAWVIVTIDGKEEFIDPTWAGVENGTDKIRSNTAYRKELERREKKKFKPQKNRSVNNYFFLTKPKVMIKTHFPDKQEDQLLTHPVSLSIFLIRSNR